METTMLPVMPTMVVLPFSSAFSGNSALRSRKRKLSELYPIEQQTSHLLPDVKIDEGEPWDTQDKEQ
jgi:hypothetical protein